MGLLYKGTSYDAKVAAITMAIKVVASYKRRLKVFLNSQAAILAVDLG